MLVTQSGKIIFEPLEFSGNEIKKAKLFISKFPDAPGILYKITGVLFVYNWNILSADIHTENSEIEDEFLLEPFENAHIDKKKLEQIEEEIMSLLLNQVHMSEYLSKFPDRTKVLIDSMKPYPGTRIYFEILRDPKKVRIHLETRDRPGLLYFVSQIFFLADFNVIDFKANTIGNIAQDVFTIQKKNDTEFSERNIKEIENLIKKFI